MKIVSAKTKRIQVQQTIAIKKPQIDPPSSITRVSLLQPSALEIPDAMLNDSLFNNKAIIIGKISKRSTTRPSTPQEFFI